MPADLDQYNQAIKILSEYQETVSKSCTELKQCTEDGVANSSSDAHVADAAKQINGVIEDIQKELAKVNQAIEGLQKQADRIRNV